MVATAETVTMLMYSARKYQANLIELYSVRYPATSSVSASGKSNGARFVSPTAATPYRMNDTGSTQKYQWLVCDATIPLVARVAEVKEDGCDRDGHRDLVGNHLRRRPQPAEQRIGRAARPPGQDDTVDAQ